MFKKRSLRLLISVQALLLTLSLLSRDPMPAAQAAFGDRITVSGSQFMAGGQRIWINGANTPWNNWNDFGGNYNASWWDSHFQQLHDNGINATRVWLTGDGEVGINIDANGFVSGATDAHWAHLDSLFSIAQSRQVYIMATFLSFDSTKNSHPNHTRWRAMFNSDANIDSYVANYVVPFANRYKNNPWLWSIDLINEPDWIVENAESGQLPWSRIQQLAAKASRAVHANSSILFSVGLAMPKYQSSTLGFGDVMSNSSLRGFVNDPLVFLDFRQTHFYDWMTPIWGNTLYMTPAGHGFDTSKPWVIGEFPAVGTAGHTTTQDYESAFNNGWQGAMAWTSNGVDSNGSLTQLGPATSTFRNNHPSLVFPGGGQPTFTPTRTPTRTNTPTQGPSSTPTRTATPTPTGTACTNPVLQAENASFGGGATADSNNAGFNSTGFINFPASGGFVQFNNVNGGAGGSTTVRIRYALGASTSRSGQLSVNGANQTITFASTSSWTTWVLQNVSVPLTAGATNTLRFQSTGQDLGNIDQIEVVLCGSATPTATPTRTTTPTPTSTPTRTPTSTPGPTSTPTPGSGACSPVTATIAAPFAFDGAGTLCWQTSSLGSFVNSWNLASLTINGVDFTNRWADTSSYPPSINGVWYISYTGNFPWSHFETR